MEKLSEIAEHLTIIPEHRFLDANRLLNIAKWMTTTIYTGQVILTDTGQIVDGYGRILISFLASGKRNITTNTEEIDLLLHGYLTLDDEYDNLYMYIRNHENQIANCECTILYVQTDRAKHFYRPVFNEFLDFLPFEAGKQISKLANKDFFIETIPDNTVIGFNKYKRFYKEWCRSDFYRICPKDAEVMKAYYRIQERYSEGIYSKEKRDSELKVLLIYIIRSRVCKRDIGRSLYKADGENLYRELCIQSKWIAKDVFKEYLTREPIYQNDPVITKYLLEQYGRMESSTGYTIEHIMPQNRKPYWQMVSKEDHSENVHKIGNLTLTKKNSELSNKSFSEKKVIYEDEFLRLNKEVINVEQWTIWQISKRTEQIAEEITKQFSLTQEAESRKKEVSIDNAKQIDKITSIKIDHEQYQCKSWMEGYYLFMEYLIQNEPVRMWQVIEERPKYFTKDKAKGCLLSNGYILKSGIPSSTIQKRLIEMIDFLGLENDRIKIEGEVKGYGDSL